MARRRSGPRGEPGRPLSDQRSRQRGFRLGHSDQRGGDDRSPYPRPHPREGAGRMTLGIDLSGKRGLVVGIANEHSIAYGCARALREAGATLAITYVNDKAEPYVRPLAETLQGEIIAPCDVRVAGQLEAVFEQIRS